MRKMFTLLFVSICTFSFVAAQPNKPTKTDTLNQVDENGKKQGYWKKKYLNGVVRYEGYFIDDKPARFFKHFYKNGKLKATLIYYDNNKSAAAHLYYKDGFLMATGQYFGMEKDSLWRYYNENGKLVASEVYDKGGKNGKIGRAHV